VRFQDGFEGAAVQIFVFIRLQLLLDFLFLIKVEVVLASQKFLLTQEFLNMSFPILTDCSSLWISSWEIKMC